MKLLVGITLFVVGLGLGLGLPLLPSRYVDQYVPKALQPNVSALEGKVVQKQREDDRLLLTVSTASGALLATFKHRTAEIALLVDRGDMVTLGLRQYEPFVQDPSITAVMKPEFQNNTPENPVERIPLEEPQEQLQEQPQTPL